MGKSKVKKYGLTLEEIVKILDEGKTIMPGSFVHKELKDKSEEKPKKKDV